MGDESGNRYGKDKEVQTAVGKVAVVHGIMLSHGVFMTDAPQGPCGGRAAPEQGRL